MASARVHLRSKALALQVTLLVLPLVVLSAVGFLSLRQDRAYAEHEATVHAQAIADDLLASFRILLTPGDSESNSWFYAFALNREGELVNPAPVVPPVAPRKIDPSNLDPQDRALWNSAQQSEVREDWTNAVETWQRFIGGKPPADFAAIAHYSLSVALEKSGQTALAEAEFKSVAKQYPDAVGETGAALAPLARLKSIPWTNDSAVAELADAADIFCSNIVTRPTFLTATLLSEAIRKTSNPEALKKARMWLEHWQRDQYSRAVAQSAIATKKIHGPGWLWAVTDQAGPIGSPGPTVLTNVTPGDFNWLVVRQSIDTNFTSADRSSQSKPIKLVSGNAISQTNQSTGQTWFYCQTQSQIERRFYDTINSTHRIPDYMGVSVSIAGMRLNGPHPGLLLWHDVGYFGRRGGGVKKEYLTEPASKVLATATDLDLGAELLGVSIWLTSPETLYRNQRARTFWFAALIGIASLGAVIGLIVVWRGFIRQVQLNELKSNFVSSVSHELRAPIASVRLMAESLESGRLSEPKKKEEYYRYIGQECRRLSALIENVLDFARIEQGRKQYEFEATDIITLMQQTIALMEPYAAEREVSLNLKMDQSDWQNVNPVFDGRAIQQALVNLVDNAIKHSPSGRTVGVGLQRVPRVLNGEPESMDSLEIWVEDGGPGIPQGEQEKIFERFYRLGSELRRETPGVGIGLSIVKHIVEAHRGKVLVSSAPGKGSRFTIQLPLAADTTKREFEA